MNVLEPIHAISTGNLLVNYVPKYYCSELANLNNCSGLALLVHRIFHGLGLWAPLLEIDNCIIINNNKYWGDRGLVCILDQIASEKNVLQKPAVNFHHYEKPTSHCIDNKYSMYYRFNTSTNKKNTAV